MKLDEIRTKAKLQFEKNEKATFTKKKKEGEGEGSYPKPKRRLAGTTWREFIRRNVPKNKMLTRKERRRIKKSESQYIHKQRKNGIKTCEKDTEW